MSAKIIESEVKRLKDCVFVDAGAHYVLAPFNCHTF